MYEFLDETAARMQHEGKSFVSLSDLTADSQSHFLGTADDEAQDPDVRDGFFVVTEHTLSSILSQLDANVDGIVDVGEFPKPAVRATSIYNRMAQLAIAERLVS